MPLFLIALLVHCSFTSVAICLHTFQTSSQPSINRTPVPLVSSVCNNLLTTCLLSSPSCTLSLSLLFFSFFSTINTQKTYTRFRGLSDRRRCRVLRGRPRGLLCLLFLPPPVKPPRVLPKAPGEPSLGLPGRGEAATQLIRAQEMNKYWNFIL
ncbi:MAG: hypothetical protein JOS17DRAFT_762142 [Linnemannia elongata]|nr:MAG: hypothetical protein JOS17DRAFT_762142 [Linnemannia elongata]